MGVKKLGGYMTENKKSFENAKGKKYYRYSFRIPEQMMLEITKSLNQHLGILSKSSWVLQAIEEKLEAEKRKKT